METFVMCIASKVIVGAFLCLNGEQVHSLEVLAVNAKVPTASVITRVISKLDQEITGGSEDKQKLRETYLRYMIKPSQLPVEY